MSIKSNIIAAAAALGIFMAGQVSASDAPSTPTVSEKQLAKDANAKLVKKAKPAKKAKAKKAKRAATPRLDAIEARLDKLESRVDVVETVQKKMCFDANSVVISC